MDGVVEIYIIIHIIASRGDHQSQDDAKPTSYPLYLAVEEKSRRNRAIYIEKSMENEKNRKVYYI